MSFFPPQKLIQEIPSVYENLHNLGATLWIPPAHANGVNQFVYPDATPPLVGADAGTVVYSQDGGVPEILGGSPVVEFNASADKITWTVPAGSPLQMNSGGGTFVTLCTPSSDTIQYPIAKSDDADVRNGYAFTLLGGGLVKFTTSNSSGGSSEITSSGGEYAPGVRLLLVATLDGAGNGKLYVNGNLVASGTMVLPSNVENDLAVGNHPTNPTLFDGSIEFAAVMDAVLTTQQITNITSLCGLLDSSTDFNDGYLTMVSSKASDINVTLQHDGVDGASGVNYQVDSDPVVYTAGAAGASIALTIPHNSGSPETIRNWSATSASSGRVGNLTYLICSSNSISVLDVSSLTALTRLYCYNNSISVLDVSSLTALTYFYCYNNSISVLDVSSLTALTYLNCSSNSISVLDVSSLTALTYLVCHTNSISVLDVSSLTALTWLLCPVNSISVLDVSSLTALTWLSCYSNSISELIAAGQDMSSTNNDIGDNNLDEAALIAFANSLGTTTTGVIYYGGNPGSAAFETWLLTGDDKGYIWINS